MAQIVMILLVVALATGAFFSWRHDLQEQGAAEQKALYEKQQLAAAQENARLEREGKEAAITLWQEAEERGIAQRAKISALQAKRRAEDDAQAKIDPVFRAWADELVPEYRIARLRQHAESLAAVAGRGGVPAQSGMEGAPPTATVPAAPGDEPWISRLRRRAAGLVGGAVE